MLDDLIHRSILIDPDRLPQEIYKTGLTPGKSGKLSTAFFGLFAFCSGQQLTDKAREYGTLPWWTPKNMKASMWRPISSLSHWFDYRLFPDSPALMHIHHLVWFSAVIFLITVFYRRLIGPSWIAALAVTMFIIDENNVLPVTLHTLPSSLEKKPLARSSNCSTIVFTVITILCRSGHRNLCIYPCLCNGT
jgi:hypothetical protein